METGRILVVDDEAINRILLSTSLQEAGYDVGEAADGQRALQMLRTGRFDVVLLDLVMPHMDGYQVLGAMKAEDGLRRIPVIVVSSSDDMDSIVRCIELGATDYLPKPFDPVLLHARLRASLASLQEERLSILRQQLAQITAAQEDERRRIAQELHDGVGPTLASLKLRLHTSGKTLARENHATAAEMEELAGLVQSCILDIRRLIQDLRPAALDELGLRPALREYASRFRQEQGITVSLDLPELGERLPSLTETALFRIVQEALANVAKHAQAEHVHVELEYGQDWVAVHVRDDGRGFDPLETQPAGHLGLWSLRERAEQLGGKFEIESKPGRGTRVSATLPVAPNGVKR